MGAPDISDADLVSNFNTATAWLQNYAAQTAQKAAYERVQLESAIRLDERGINPAAFTAEDGVDTPDNVVELVPSGDDSEG